LIIFAILLQTGPNRWTSHSFWLSGSIGEANKRMHLILSPLPSRSRGDMPFVGTTLSGWGLHSSNIGTTLALPHRLCHRRSPHIPYIYPKQFDQFYPNDTVVYPPKPGFAITEDVPVMAPHDWTGEGSA